MSFVTHPTVSSRLCIHCGRGPVASRARSHSMVRTNKTIWKNLQKTPLGLACAKCAKTARKKALKA